MRVLAFGVFDRVHKGHEHFLRSASTYGELHVVIAHSSASEALKGRKPILSHEERKQAVEALPYVHAAYIGDTELGSWSAVRKVCPDVIAIGYDQSRLQEHLQKWLQEQAEYEATIVRIDAFEPEYYKSSLRNSYDR